jgi:hypothetical protein
MNLSLLKKIAVFIIFFSTLHNAFGQNILLSEKTRVSVLTCGTGNESYSLFGHTAIRINDTDNAIDVVYNYGTFDFTTPNFVAKFAKGDLQYMATVHSFYDFINEYTYERRSVYEQELAIPLALKQQLFDDLNKTIRSDERFYTYKFIDKNCTSMVVDIINTTLDTTAIVKNEDTNSTYRTILYPYFDNHFYEKLGTSIIFGTKVDQLGTKLFLPFELQKSLKKVQFQNHLLAPENKILLEFEKEIPKSGWNNCYTYLAFLGFILLINKKVINLSYLTIMGLLGLFFVAVGFYSLHQELAYNYNILLFNPSLLVLLYFYLTKNKTGIYNLACFNILSLVVYLVILINKAHLLIVLPLVITSGILLVKLGIQNRKRDGNDNGK